MFRHLAEDITYLLIKNKILDIEDREIYLYGMEAVVLNTSILVAILIISIFGKGMYHFVAFICFFIPLRCLAGGYHAKNSETCFVLTIMVYIGSLIVDFIYPDMSENTYAIFVVAVALLIIFLGAPVKSVIHPLNDYQYKRNKVLMSGLIILDLVALYFLNQQKSVIASSEVIFLILVSAIVVVGKLKNREKIVM